jgi:glucose/arabinose dehydrogenase
MKWIAAITASVFLGTALPAYAAAPLQVDVLTRDLDSPWGLAQLPDGRWLVTERSGTLRRLDARGVREAIIAHAPQAFVEGQGGLLDVVLHPQFAGNSLIYLSLASGAPGNSRLLVVRAELRGDALQNPKTVFESAPRRTSAHYAGSLAFMRDGTLLITVGDGYEDKVLAQNLDVLRGKVARIHDDGSAPADNPFVGRAQANPLVWSYGHRNPQGLGIDPATGTVYVSEHGPQGGDEINVIERGINYGWPVATHGLDYTGGKISPFQTYAGMREPILFWDPSIAPAGLTVYRGSEFPEWDGDLLVGVLRDRHLRRISMADGKVQGQQILLADRNGRFREIQVGSDGAIYTLAESIDGKEKSGQLMRLSRAPPTASPQNANQNAN